MGERVQPGSAVRWTLVLSVLCGLVAMHALVLGHSTHIVATFPAHATAAVSSAGHGSTAPPTTAASPAIHAVADHPGAHDAAGHAAPAAAPGRVDAAAGRAVEGADGADGRTATGHSPAGHSPAGHDHGLLHLCLAVLTALAGLVAVPLLARLLSSVVAGLLHRTGRGRRTVTTPAAPPPPSAVRLAQLCVLRT